MNIVCEVEIGINIGETETLAGESGINDASWLTYGTRSCPVIAVSFISFANITGCSTILASQQPYLKIPEIVRIELSLQLKLLFFHAHIIVYTIRF